MNREDLPSDSDSDDADYCPVNDSGSDSIDEKDELLLDQDNEQPTKRNKKKRKKSHKTKNIRAEFEESANESNKTVCDPEEEKKRVDALWADFLGGSDIPSKPKEETINAKPTQSKPDIPKAQKIKASSPPPKIFEFAGETVELTPKESGDNALRTNNVTKPAVATSSVGVKRPGGLASVLGQLSKKNKLSVLEKTKLDWDGFKSTEGISEDLKTHNKGRDGFLERRDFLERTDLRQFEIEKNMRMTSRRSK